MASTILSDNGASSGSAGLKSSADSTGVLALQTSTSGGAATTALTIDTSQNVGIGTASPANKLDVAGIITASGSPSNPTGTTVSFYNGSGVGPTISGYQFAVRTGGTPTEAMRIDSSGNVGIGRTSPTARLHLTTASGNTALTLSTNNNDNANATLYNDATYLNMGSNFGSTGQKMKFALAMPDNSVTVDSSGRLTVPNQPGFRAGLDTSTAIASGGIFQFNNVTGAGRFNDGGYSTSTGRFTAPVAGRYLFLVEVIVQDVPNNTDMTDMMYPYINGVISGYSNNRSFYVSNTTGSSGYYVDTVFAIFKLAANDIVDIRAKSAYTQHGNVNYSIFQGYLLG